MNNTEIGTAIDKWIKHFDCDVFATLVFNRNMHKHNAVKSIKRYLNLLDIKVMQRKAVRKGKRIERFAVLQSGKSKDNWHCHILFNSKSTVATANELKQLAEIYWQTRVRHAKRYDRKFEMNGTFELIKRQRDFEIIENKKAVKRYLLSEVKRYGSLTILPKLIHFTKETKQRLSEAQ